MALDLEVAIVCLWIIASLLACWCFSLIVRLITEWIARKRKRLAARYAKKSLVLAILLFGVSAMGAMVGAGSAYVLSTEQGVRSVITPIGAIGGGMLFFACFLVIWASIGDRSRGRLRCPRCWYDMRDSRGMPCPECGREISDDHQLLRTRRPRWAFVLAGMFILVGVGGITLNARVSRLGLLSLIPDRALVSWREQLPQNWIFDHRAGGIKDSLQQRIEHGRIDTALRREIALQLIDEMLAAKDARWDFDRIGLLESIYGIEVRDWKPEDQRLEQLLLLCAQDLCDALAARNPTPLDEQILNPSDIHEDCYKLCRAWLLGYWPASSWRYSVSIPILPRNITENRKLAQTLMGVCPEERGVHLQDYIAQCEAVGQDRLVQLLIDTSLLGEHRHEFVDAGLSQDIDLNGYPAFCHALSILMLQDQAQARAASKLFEMLSSPDSARRSYALHVGIELCRNADRQDAADAPWLQELVAAADDLARTDERVPATSEHGVTISALARVFIMSGDRSGHYAFPLFRENLLEFGTAGQAFRSSRSSGFVETDERIENWLLNFADLIHHEDPKIRLWVIKNIPDRTGTAHDERLDALVAQMTHDEDFEVADEAMLKRQYRVHQVP